MNVAHLLADKGYDLAAIVTYALSSHLVTTILNEKSVRLRLHAHNPVKLCVDVSRSGQMCRAIDHAEHL